MLNKTEKNIADIRKISYTLRFPIRRLLLKDTIIIAKSCRDKQVRGKRIIKFARIESRDNKDISSLFTFAKSKPFGYARA